MNIQSFNEVEDAHRVAVRAEEKAQAAFDRAVLDARVAIAALEVPWKVSGLVILTPEETEGPPPPVMGNIKSRNIMGGRVSVPKNHDPNQISLDPHFVCLQRFEREFRVKAYPAASAQEALAMAADECKVAAEAYSASIAAIVERTKLQARMEALNEARRAETNARYRVDNWHHLRSGRSAEQQNAADALVASNMAKLA